jgi:hypothetical protein
MVQSGLLGNFDIDNCKKKKMDFEKIFVLCSGPVERKMCCAAR